MPSKDQKVTGPVGFRYTGNGAFFEGLPTHDIRADEVPQHLAPIMVRAIELGLYEPIFQEEINNAQSS